MLPRHLVCAAGSGTVRRYSEISCVVALGDGVRAMWNERNVIGVVTMARGIVEACATYWSFERALSEAAAAKDFKGVYDQAMAHTFNTRWEGFPEALKKLPNILTLLRKMDRDIYGSKEAARRVSRVHAAMSELVHPNWAGTTGVFGRLDKQMRTYHFADPKKLDSRTISTVIAGAGTLRLIQMVHGKIDLVLPAIWQLSDADASGHKGRK